MALASSAAKGRATAGFLSDSAQDAGADVKWLGPHSIWKISKRFHSTHKRVKEGEVFQCCAGEKWMPRRLIMTNSSLIITLQEDDRVLTEISFVDVEEVASMQHELACTHQELAYMNFQRRKHSEGNHLAETEVEHKRDHTFKIHVGATMFKDAHTICFQAANETEVADWVEALKLKQDAWSSKNLQPKFHQIAAHRIAAIYYNTLTQGIIALFIFANFVANAVQAQLVPEEDTPQDTFFERLDLAFTIVFTVELMVNLGVNWFRPFFSDGWNLFDVIVVTTSLVALLFDDLPGISILRIVRAFRVLRLFGRLGSLRRIINALTCSWLPVLNAFAVVMFITAVYAILGVTFFRSRNEYHFGSFTKAFVTMFTVTTMEGWVELMEEGLAGEAGIETGVAVFFISFILIVVWTMLPVVVAILLDNFTKAATKEEAKADQASMISTHDDMYHTLDPLMSILAMFSSEDELRIRISQVYQLLNPEELSTLGYDDLRHGFSKLNIPDVLIDLTYEEYQRLTKHGALCDDEDRLGPREFERVLVRELRDFTERGIANAMAMEMVSGSPGMVAALCSLKMQGLEFDDELDELETIVNERRQASDLGARSPAQRRRRSTVSQLLNGAIDGLKRRRSSTELSAEHTTEQTHRLAGSGGAGAGEEEGVRALQPGEHEGGRVVAGGGVQAEAATRTGSASKQGPKRGVFGVVKKSASRAKAQAPQGKQPSAAAGETGGAEAERYAELVEAMERQHQQVMGLLAALQQQVAAGGGSTCSTPTKCCSCALPRSGRDTPEASLWTRPRRSPRADAAAAGRSARASELPSPLAPLRRPLQLRTPRSTAPRSPSAAHVSQAPSEAAGDGGQSGAGMSPGRAARALAAVRAPEGLTPPPRARTPQQVAGAGAVHITQSTAPAQQLGSPHAPGGGGHGLRWSHEPQASAHKAADADPRQQQWAPAHSAGGGAASVSGAPSNRSSGPSLTPPPAGSGAPSATPVSAATTGGGRGGLWASGWSATQQAGVDSSAADLGMVNAQMVNAQMVNAQMVNAQIGFLPRAEARREAFS